MEPLVSPFFSSFSFISSLLYLFETEKKTSLACGLFPCLSKDQSHVDVHLLWRAGVTIRSLYLLSLSCSQSAVYSLGL